MPCTSPPSMRQRCGNGVRAKGPKPIFWGCSAVGSGLGHLPFGCPAPKASPVQWASMRHAKHRILGRPPGCRLRLPSVVKTNKEEQPKRLSGKAVLNKAQRWDDMVCSCIVLVDDEVRRGQVLRLQGKPMPPRQKRIPWQLAQQGIRARGSRGKGRGIGGEQDGNGPGVSAEGGLPGFLEAPVGDVGTAGPESVVGPYDAEPTVADEPGGVDVGRARGAADERVRARGQLWRGRRRGRATSFGW